MWQREASICAAPTSAGMHVHCWKELNWKTFGQDDTYLYPVYAVHCLTPLLIEKRNYAGSENHFPH